MRIRAHVHRSFFRLSDMVPCVVLNLPSVPCMSPIILLVCALHAAILAPPYSYCSKHVITYQRLVSSANPTDKSATAARPQTVSAAVLSRTVLLAGAAAQAWWRQSGGAQQASWRLRAAWPLLQRSCWRLRRCPLRLRTAARPSQHPPATQPWREQLITSPALPSKLQELADDWHGAQRRRPNATNCSTQNTTLHDQAAGSTCLAGLPLPFELIGRLPFLPDRRCGQRALPPAQQDASQADLRLFDTRLAAATANQRTAAVAKTISVTVYWHIFRCGRRRSWAALKLCRMP
jgi:hypothetical protein